MKNLILLLFLVGIMNPIWGQTDPVELKEIELVAVNYKYLDATTRDEVAVPVKKLEEMVAKFDIKSSEVYHDDYDLYEVSFFIPEGQILAAYDKDGKLLKTVERFKNVGLPGPVQKAIKAKYPDWTITKDIYKVNYTDDRGADKIYKVRIDKGEDRMRVKLDEKGNFQK
ncbi:nicotinate-nucleotide adenylyltransferase [Salinimicrobium flavum]|uniref:Nicotinate-nucleotide adenylyltransferase n=1 Tax=Salinimicrobium flavum TaxID=1737065 RepID=A0ABW5J1B6_9FLAO